MTGANSFQVSGYGPERAGWTRVFARDGVARRLDWPILLSATVLSLLGSLLVFSATRNRTDINQDDPYYFLVRHLLNTGIGIALMIGVIWLGHRTLRTAVPILYGASVFLILLVLTPLGTTINGAHSWIKLPGGFSLQPSEFVKITIILGMAMLLATRVDAGDKQYPDHRTVLQALGLAVVPSLIVMLMPDLGSVMVMVVIVLGVLLASGASNRWVLGLISAGAIGSIAVWQLGILDDYQINRFAAFANPELDPAGVGYNTNQARIAIGSGGLTGAGLFNGSQTTGQFVPEQQTDFVFTVAGRSWASSGPASSSSCWASSCGVPAASPGTPPTCTARSSPRASSPGSPSRPSRTSA